MEIIVLSQNGCVPCSMVKKYLANEGVDFREINISEAPSAVEEFGIMSTPVTILMDEGEEVVRVKGFAPDDLEALAEQL